MISVLFALPIFMASVTPQADGGVPPPAPAKIELTLPAPIELTLPAPVEVKPPVPDELAPPAMAPAKVPAKVPVAVTVEGSAVPIVAPKAEAKVAPVLAPELVVPPPPALLVGPPKPIIAAASLSVYNVDLASEIPITAGAFGLYLMVDILIKPTLQAGISCQVPGGNGQCDPADLSSFDRYAVGKSSQAWSIFSDVALGASIVIPVLYLGLESLTLPTKKPWGDFTKDLVVVAESMAVTAAVDNILKFAFRRPRPSRYLPDPPPGPASYDAELSLPSGHAAMVSAATTALTTTIFLRHPKSKVRFLALGVGVALSGLTALARVESGNHFPTDVITGLVVGAVAGFAVPYLHRKPLRVLPSISYNAATETAMLSVSGNL